MGNHPGGIQAVAVEAATELVVDSARGHFLQAEGRYF